MALLIPGGWAQASFLFGGDACPTGAAVTLGLNVELWEGDAQALAEELGDLWTNSIANRQTNTCVLESVLVKFGPVSVGQRAEASVGTNGAVVSVNEPPNAAVLVSKQTGIGGRQGRGRMFIPGPAFDLFDAQGVMSSSARTQWQTVCEEFRTGLNTLGVPPALLHDENAPISAPYLIVGFDVQTRAATQRRRLRR